MEPDFWKEVGQQIGITGVGLGIGGYILKRWLVKNITEDGAVNAALAVKDEIIKQLRMELRERDGDWQTRWDRREKEALEYRQRVEREFKVFRSISQAVSKDIRTLAAAGSNTIPEERLETQILITGMGPLDP